MSVARNGIDCLCPPGGAEFPGVGKRPVPKVFPELRIEVFQAVARHLPFAHWQSIQPDDVGLMITDWMVYLLDNLSFYNDRWMREQHISTADLVGSLRQIAALTGYQPRPNLGATARLAVITDRQAPFVVPAGRTIASEGSEEAPALTFETVGEASIDPTLSQMSAIPPRDTRFDPGFLAIGGAVRNMRIDEPLLLQHGAVVRAVLVREINPDKFLSGESYAQLVVDPDRSESLTVFDGVELDSIQLRSCADQTEAVSKDSRTLSLAGVHPGFHEEQALVLMDPETEELLLTSVTGITRRNVTLVSSATSPVVAVHTDIEVSAALVANRAYRIYHRLVRAAHLVGAPKTHLTLGDFGGTIRLQEKYFGATLAYSGAFVVMDDDDRAVPIEASLAVEPKSRRASLDLLSVEDDSIVLRAPLRVLGAFLEVDQGTTTIETLGSTSGRRYQRFRLRERPLTFLRQPEVEPAPALEVFVDNVRWRYSPHLYGVAAHERAFVLKVEADGQAHVILAGVTSPGQKNVVARYRYGTTGDNPAAMKINKPKARIEGVAKLFNPNRAVGGLVGDTAHDMRYVLPARISANDRCVSAHDFEVLSESFGAQKARARRFWNPRRRRTEIEVIVVYEGSLNDALRDKLRAHLTNHAAEGTQIEIVGATPRSEDISLLLRAAADADPESLRRSVLDIYLHEFTGLLSPRRIRIGHAYTRAEILAPLSKVKEIGSVQRLALGLSETIPALTLSPTEYLQPVLTVEATR
jgi:hypothetical protein